MMCYTHLRVIRWVVLDDPVNLGDVQPSRSNIGTKKRPLLGFTELQECGGALLLLLATLEEEGSEG